MLSFSASHLLLLLCSGRTRRRISNTILHACIGGHRRISTVLHLFLLFVELFLFLLGQFLAVACTTATTTRIGITTAVEKTRRKSIAKCLRTRCMLRLSSTSGCSSLLRRRRRRLCLLPMWLLLRMLLLHLPLLLNLLLHHFVLYEHLALMLVARFAEHIGAVWLTPIELIPLILLRHTVDLLLQVALCRIEIVPHVAWQQVHEPILANAHAVTTQHVRLLYTFRCAFQ
mmetsp:Transcript_32641/g.52941  ORF Transcript_32641/g.52941 Transcript_32641/m.52941 type:complete len:229 (+) Transcript_32641:1131-1817(+)